MSDTIQLGKTTDGHAVELNVLRLIDSRSLIQASSGGGKSYLLRLIAERTAASVPFLLIDPEGEFATLREILDLILVGQSGEIQANPRTAAVLARRLAETNSSAVIDLSELDLGGRREFVKQFATALIDLPRNLWRPRIVAIDESHLFAPERSAGEAVSTDAVINLMSMGRKRGICGILATQRISKLHKDAAAEAGNVFTGRTTLDIDQKRAADILGMGKEDRLALRDLADGEWFAFGPALKMHGVVRFKGDRVKTTHPKAGERHKLKPPPPSASVKGMVAEMADLAARDPDEAVTLEDAQGIIGRLKSDLRKKTTDFERQLKQAPTSVNSAVIEAAMQTAVLKRDKEWQIAIREREGIIENLKGKMSKAAGILHVNGEAVASKPVPATIPAVAVRATPVPTVARAAPVRREEQSGTGDLKIGRCHRAILSVLAAHGPSASGRLTLLAGYRYSGGFQNALSDLRTAGMIEGANNSVMSITGAGIDAGPFDELPHGDDLRVYWLNHRSFGACERKILSVLIDAYPDGRTHQEICDATGYAYSGGFQNALSCLRTAGILKGKNTESMVASETLFE